VGENGRIFHMLKFRTMIPNAERLRPMVEQVDEDGHMIHKRSDDPRVTRIGHILRRTSLDELPQVFNILKGEMSLVGPRPELPYLVEKYEAWQHRRFTVPQGLTGWWQVNGRSEKPMHLHTEDDLYYIQHYSVFLDILILFKTIGAVLQGKGAF
jgi:lipopolysaccharide/colanic/teichoic acid biosynthesis glycosyltransferase